MLIIDCPYCGERPEIEFVYGGQAHIARPLRPAQLDDEAWAGFLYLRDNIKGVHAERWRHSHGCGRFFNALRDTTTDHFLAFYRVGEPRPAITPTAAAHPAHPAEPAHSAESDMARAPRHWPAQQGASHEAAAESPADAPRDPRS